MVSRETLNNWTVLCHRKKHTHRHTHFLTQTNRQTHTQMQWGTDLGCLWTIKYGFIFSFVFPSVEKKILNQFCSTVYRKGRAAPNATTHSFPWTQSLCVILRRKKKHQSLPWTCLSFTTRSGFKTLLAYQSDKFMALKLQSRNPSI